jgi:hypothetical protein
MVRMTKILPPPSRALRISVPVDGDTMEVFKRLAKAGNMSTGRAMAEWLKDTVDAAELMASTMERARAAPKIVTAELHAMALGMADMSKDLHDKFRGYRGSIAKGASAAQPPRPSGDTFPPPCNTGGKVPKRGNTQEGGKPL